jgi:hypothetical protein
VRSISLLAALIGGATLACAQIPHIHPILKYGKAAAGTAIVLPAQVVFAKVGFKGVEGMEAEAEKLGEQLYKAIGAELAARGVVVLPNPAQAAIDDAAKYRVSDLQAKFDHVRLPVSRRPGRVDKGQFTMGDAVATFEPGKADLLVFIRASGTVRTGGSKFLGAVLLNPFLAMPEFHGDVTLVDAKSGDILAFLRFRRTNNAASQSEEQFQKIAHLTFRDVPLPKSWQK